MSEDKIPKIKERMKALRESYAYKANQVSRYGKVKEAKVNKDFFDRHANIGLTDNKAYPTRDLIQCPVIPHHKVGIRRAEAHLGHCKRTHDVTIDDCEINEKHHNFRRELAAEHYPLCATFLLLKYRFAHGWPAAYYYEHDFRSVSIRRWSAEEAAAVKEDLCGAEPWLGCSKKHPPHSQWYLRDTNTHQMEMTGILLEDLCEDVKEAAEKIEKSLDQRAKSRPLPNFYGRRPPRLEIPRYKQLGEKHFPLVPVKKSKRVHFDFDAWLYSDCDRLKSNDFQQGYFPAR
ncbi:uncharacterized protein LOC129589392 [Paramacrobiotus metropolitanus]|uniref:uncharacterized protein LOC129589392 n=1 Tax=Paramacrobiotus metropolitanus TaxID=2943436 RepID=UPI0024459235|nr:uncharacterized protein LOC129589392 [Paramacrobiotus metropolitanus]XP_055340121.1 uncharacterized protein LOC129589392 [Paramacrobiotus metropolitanus]